MRICRTTRGVGRGLFKASIPAAVAPEVMDANEYSRTYRSNMGPFPPPETLLAALKDVADYAYTRR